jgi:hypothetical protein
MADTSPPRIPKDNKGGQPVVQQRQLLQRMEEATTILRTLKEERDAAYTRIGALEHENRETHALLTLVEAKVEEMLTAAAPARAAHNAPPAPVQRRVDPTAMPSSDQPRQEPVAVAPAPRRVESPVAQVQQKAETPPPPAERRVETPVVPARPEAEIKATSTEAAPDRVEQVAAPPATEDKTVPKGFADLKERFRRPFP